MFSAGAKRTAWDTQADRNKADYIYLEALGSIASEDDETASWYQHHYFQRAYNLDTTQTRIGAELAYYYFPLIMQTDDTTYISRAIELQGRYLSANPHDTDLWKLYVNTLNRYSTPDATLNAATAAYTHNPGNREFADRLVREYMKVEPYDSTAHYSSIAVIDSIESRYGADAPFTLLRTASYLMYGDTARAIDSVVDLTNQRPTDQSALRMAASVYDHLGYDSLCLEYLYRNWQLDTLDGTSLYLLATKNLEMGDSTTYLDLTARAVVLPEMDGETRATILHDMGAAVYDRPELRDRTDRIFDDAVETAPYEPMVQSVVTQYLLSTDRPQEALLHARIALDLDPDNTRSKGALMSLYALNKQYDNALSILSELMAAEPNNSSYIFYDISLAQEMGGDEKTLECINKYLLNDSLPDYIRASLYSSRSITYENLDSIDLAFDDIEAAFILNPDDPTILNNYAWKLCLYSDDYARAEDYILRALGSRPAEPTYLDTYAWILFKARKYPEAKEYIDMAIENISEDDNTDMKAELYHHAGDIYFWNQMPDEALEWWQQALKLDPDNELLKRKVEHKTYFHQ